MLHGAAAFREALSEKLELTANIYQKLMQMQQNGAPIELVAAPQLSLLAFRLRRAPGESLAAYNRRNNNLLTAINARKRIWISSTNLPVDDGLACSLRVCVLSFRTHQAHADFFVEDLAAALAEVTR
ncbi:MAG: decarboxylase, partial [Nannocystaceae bacterium]